MSASISLNPVTACQAKAEPTTLRVGGLAPLTTGDFPGCLSAVVFCQGCPWQCGYCHNPHLIPAAREGDLPWEQVRGFLQKRQGLLDAVVFSGGEPTLQAGLADAMRETREMGFRIGLHTAGNYPERLEKVLPLLDWVGMDIKAPFADYARITGVSGSGAKAWASARLLLASGVAHEFRTTVHPALLGDVHVQILAQELAELGARHYVLQEFRPNGCRDETLCAMGGAFDVLQAPLEAKLSKLFESFAIRRA